MLRGQGYVPKQGIIYCTRLYVKALVYILVPPGARCGGCDLSLSRRSTGRLAKTTRPFGPIGVELGSIRALLGPNWVGFARNSTPVPGIPGTGAKTTKDRPQARSQIRPRQNLRICLTTARRAALLPPTHPCPV